MYGVHAGEGEAKDSRAGTRPGTPSSTEKYIPGSATVMPPDAIVATTTCGITASRPAKLCTYVAARDPLACAAFFETAVWRGGWRRSLIQNSYYYCLAGILGSPSLSPLLALHTFRVRTADLFPRFLFSSIILSLAFLVLHPRSSQTHTSPSRSLREHSCLLLLLLAIARSTHPFFSYSRSDTGAECPPRSLARSLDSIAVSSRAHHTTPQQQ